MTKIIGPVPGEMTNLPFIIVLRLLLWERAVLSENEKDMVLWGFSHSMDQSLLMPQSGHS